MRKETLYKTLAATPETVKIQTALNRDSVLLKEVVDTFGGAIVFSVVGLKKDKEMIIKFDRIDAGQDLDQSLNHETRTITQAYADPADGIVYSLFAGTSCDGEYTISISMDGGESFIDLPVPDIETRIPSKVFKLPQDTCIRPVTIEFPNTSNNKS